MAPPAARIRLARVAIALSLFASATLPSPAAAQSPASPEVQGRARAAVAATLEDLHFQHIRPDRQEAFVQRVATALVASDTSSREWQTWLLEQGIAEMFSFLPMLAKHNPETRYLLPFDTTIPGYLSQGPGSPERLQGRTHYGPGQYAWDFVMPIGSVVRAAREGVVARVIDGFETNTAGIGELHHANLVLILHSDGSSASYVHLDRGIPVREGQRVAAGQPIGRSGHTGFSTAPHLHFSVEVARIGGEVQTIPIRFGPPGSPGYLPKEGQFLMPNIQPAGKVRVYVGDVEVVPGTPLVVQPGSEHSLRVERVSFDGIDRDVTREPTTRILAMTPWVIEVSDGRVRVAPSEGYGGDHRRFFALQKGNLAKIYVTVGRAAEPPSAVAVVDLRIAPAKKAKTGPTGGPNP